MTSSVSLLHHWARVALPLLAATTVRVVAAPTQTDATTAIGSSCDSVAERNFHAYRLALQDGDDLARHFSLEAYAKSMSLLESHPTAQSAFANWISTVTHLQRQIAIATTPVRAACAVAEDTSSLRSTLIFSITRSDVDPDARYVFVASYRGRISNISIESKLP
jgi:hypothetical protein